MTIEHVWSYTDEFLVGVYMSGDWHEKQLASAELAARFVKGFTERHTHGLVAHAVRTCQQEQASIEAIAAQKPHTPE